MGSEVEIVEERLKSFLDQLQTEFGILDRIVYKNKNQHRRSLYFQYLLKVRRDLKLLQLAHLEEIVNSSFLVINGKRPKQKVQLLESLKRKRCDGAKLNFLERLLGVARLLSQMVEPMLKAATDISTLLAQSFFMGFSLTTLALLARLRVLVQQILLDVVSVFNMVSSLSQKEQSVKITQEGFEVFREYYPKNEEAISLECVWEKDKFVLVEKMDKIEIRNQEMDTEIDVATASSSQIQYQSIEAWLGDAAAADDKSGDMNPKNSVEVCEPPPENVLNSTISQDSNPLKRKSLSREKVAFLSVKRPASSVAKDSGLKLERTEPASSVAKDLGLKLERTENSDDRKDDPFFSLLTGGNPKGSLF